MRSYGHGKGARSLGAAAALPGLSGAAEHSRAEGNDVMLVSRGKSSHVILVAEESSDSERFAAEELQRYLERMSGCRIPVVSELEAPKEGPWICVGVSAKVRELLPEFEVSTLKEEGIRIKTVGSSVMLLGSRERGTLYAVYSFLERLGVRFFAPHAEKVPHAETIRVPEIDGIHLPSFRYRLVTYPDYLRPDYAPKLKINLSPDLDGRHGGKIGIAFPHMTHTFYQLVPPETYFASNPECFALVNGQRQQESAQLCLTQPATIRIAAATVLRWMEEEPGSHSFGVVQNDWLGFCECDACQALDEQEGSHAGSLIFFCNEIGKRVAERYPQVGLDGVPEKMIHTIAYTYTEKPPRFIRPAPNVAVVLCHMHPSCDSHPIETCPQNAAYREHLKGWLAKTQQVLIWHYVVDFSHFCLPFPNLNSLRADLPWYNKMGVRGVLCQATTMPGAGKEMSELRNYVCAKLLWNAGEDVEALLGDFMEGYFGPAGEPMRKVFDLLHEKVKDPSLHMHLYSGLEAGYLTPEVIEEMGQLFEDAEVRVKDDPELLRRVRKERMGEWYARLIQHPQFVAQDGLIEAADRAERQAWLEKFLKAAEENQIVRHCEDLSLDVFERRQRFLCESHSILALAEFAPTVMALMDAAFCEAQSRSTVVEGRPYVNVVEMRHAEIGKWFGPAGLVELEHYLNEYNITQRSPFNIWTRYLSEKDYRSFQEPRLKG